MPADPIIFSDWREAKRAAAVMAVACGAELLQTEDGSKRVILGKTVKTFSSWLSAYSFLWRVRADQIGYKKSK